jgi:hypothetical protein
VGGVFFSFGAGCFREGFLPRMKVDASGFHRGQRAIALIRRGGDPNGLVEKSAGSFH